MLSSLPRGSAEAELMSIVPVFYVFHYLEQLDNWRLLGPQTLSSRTQMRRKMKEGRKICSFSCFRVLQVLCYGWYIWGSKCNSPNFPCAWCIHPSGIVSISSFRNADSSYSMWKNGQASTWWVENGLEKSSFHCFAFIFSECGGTFKQCFQLWIISFVSLLSLAKPFLCVHNSHHDNQDGFGMQWVHTLERRNWSWFKIISVITAHMLS